MSKKDLEKIQKAERKAQREQDRALIKQQKDTFEQDLIQMDKDKVRSADLPQSTLGLRA